MKAFGMQYSIKQSTISGPDFTEGLVEQHLTHPSQQYQPAKPKRAWHRDMLCITHLDFSRLHNQVTPRLKEKYKVWQVIGAAHCVHWYDAGNQTQAKKYFTVHACSDVRRFCKTSRAVLNSNLPRGLSSKSSYTHGTMLH